MAAKYQEGRFYPVSDDYFRNKLRSINTAGLNLVLKSENETPTGVWYRIHHGTTFSSWGEKITVTLTRNDGGTGVDILSECGMPTQVVDWGKNRKNVIAIFNHLEKGMPASGGVYAQPAVAPFVNAAPAGEPQSQPFGFCPKCGTKHAAGAKFCVSCGNKL